MANHVFLLLLKTVALLGVGALAYLWTRFRRFEWLRALPRRTNMIYAALPTAALALWWLCGTNSAELRWLGSMNALVAILHLALFWLLCDGTALCFRHSARLYYAGYAAIVFTALYLGYGYIACHQVAATGYSLSTSKNIGGGEFRIALIADVHLDEIFESDVLAKHLARIAAEKPDVLVIAGDLVDVGTTSAEVECMAQALTAFPAPLGKYFIFGNHDCRCNFKETEWPVFPCPSIVSLCP